MYLISADEITIVKLLCENWDENWQIDFPHLNLTPRNITRSIETHTVLLYVLQVGGKG